MRDTIKSLTKKGLSQKAIALKLKIRKTKVVAAQKKFKIGTRSAFGKDVAAFRGVTGESYKSAVHTIKMTEKWIGKRVKKLSEEEQAMQKAWARHKREYRRAAFKARKRKSEGREKYEKTNPFELSQRILDTYENYFETEQ